MKGEFMEINNSGVNDISLGKTNTLVKAEESQKDNAKQIPPVNTHSVELSLSAPGRLTQELDQTSMEIDQILSSHLSTEQKKELNNIYQKLDKAFESDDGSANAEHKIENLFEQAHKILETSVDKLSTSEKKQVDTLINKMDSLEHKLAGFEQHEFSAPMQVSSGQAQRHEANESNIVAPAKTKKTLSVAELNALSAAELNKLPAHLLKKLNAQQLNKLNASQLNLLPENLLSKLTPSNLAKVAGSST